MGFFFLYLIIALGREVLEGKVYNTLIVTLSNFLSKAYSFSYLLSTEVWAVVELKKADKSLLNSFSLLINLPIPWIY